MDEPGNLLSGAVEDAAAWTHWTPMPGQAPRFQRDAGSLGISGAGNPHGFGAWCRSVPVTAGQTYRLRVAARVTGVDDLGLHFTPHILWHRGEEPDEHCAVDALRACRWEEARLVGEDSFAAPAGCVRAEVRLLLRYAPEGTAWFDEVSLAATQPPPARPVRLGTVRGCPASPATAADHLSWYGECIDRLVPTAPDLILLPEFANTAAMHPARGTALLERAESLPGPFCRMLSDRARAGGCYLCAGVLERDGGHVYNAAVLYDRRGKLVGVQRKVHPYWPEEPMGVVPGDTFQVFATDFGIVGIMICYDSWWPESARLLALKGAELILFPNAGYESKIMPARAIDNNVYLLTASLYSAATVIDTRGDLMASTAVDGVLSAEVDLGHRPKCHPNAGGNLNPGPGGARWARNARSAQIYEEILAQVQDGG